MGVWLASRVATARQTYADQHDDQGLFHSPRIYTDRIFMIAFRNQMIFLEYLLLFLPLLWLAAVSYGDYWVASLSLSYVLGRFLLCARNYPMGHRGGVMVAYLSMLILLFAVAATAIFIGAEEMLTGGLAMGMGMGGGICTTYIMMPRRYLEI